MDFSAKAVTKCTYGMEGLEGLRVGNADALEIRIGYYGKQKLPVSGVIH